MGRQYLVYPCRVIISLNHAFIEDNQVCEATSNIIGLMLVVVIAATLAGCSTSVISSSPRNVVVESQSLNAAEAQRLADVECQKHSRYAKMTIKGDYWERNYTFECVE